MASKRPQKVQAKGLKTTRRGSQGEFLRERLSAAAAGHIADRIYCSGKTTKLLKKAWTAGSDPARHSNVLFSQKGFFYQRF